MSKADLRKMFGVGLPRDHAVDATLHIPTDDGNGYRVETVKVWGLKITPDDGSPAYYPPKRLK